MDSGTPLSSYPRPALGPRSRSLPPFQLPAPEPDAPASTSFASASVSPNPLIFSSPQTLRYAAVHPADAVGPFLCTHAGRTRPRHRREGRGQGSALRRALRPPTRKRFGGTCIWCASASAWTMPHGGVQLVGQVEAHSSPPADAHGRHKALLPGRTGRRRGGWGGGCYGRRSSCEFCRLG